MPSEGLSRSCWPLQVSQVSNLHLNVPHSVACMLGQTAFLFLLEVAKLYEQVQQKVERLVAIWEERKVFGMSGTKPFTELVEAAGTPKKASGILPVPTLFLTGAQLVR